MPQLVRDAVGLHLVWGKWCLSRGRRWRFSHVRRYAAMGATQIDVWVGLWLRLDRVVRR